MRKNKILVGVVVFNEEEKIEKVLSRVKETIRKYNYVFVFVDDHSTDNSLIQLKAFVENHVRSVLLSNAKNSGVGKSIKKIIAYGIKHSFDTCVIMAGNGKDNPLEIHKLITPIIKRKYDYVQGSRFLKGGSFNHLPFLRKLMVRGFTFIVWIFTGFWGSDASNGFRAYKLSLFNDRRINIHQPWLDRYEFETYLHYKVITLGYKIYEVPVSKNYLPEVESYSKIKPIVDWWKMVRPLIFLKMQYKS